MTNSRTTPSSDLEQALAALRDLAEAVRVGPDPGLVSAWHQARLVLRGQRITVVPAHRVSRTAAGVN